MSAASLRELIDDRASLLPLTVEQYRQMIASGTIPEGEPYELLDGYIVRKNRSAAGEDPMTVGDHHAYVVVMLADLAPRLRRSGCHIRMQQPVALSPDDEPEPDASVVRVAPQDDRDRRPSPADILCVVEVADASLRRDRTVKQRIYANGGVPLYVIINLQDGVAEVYAEPMSGKGRYAKSVTLTPSQMLSLPTGKGKGLSIPLRRLLP